MGKMKNQIMGYYGTCDESDVPRGCTQPFGYINGRALLPGERVQHDLSQKFRIGRIDDNNNENNDEMDLYSYIKKILNIRNNNIINLLMLLYDRFGIENLFCTRFVILGTIPRYSSEYFNFITTEYFIYKLLGEKYYEKCTDKLIDIYNSKEANANIINKSIKAGYHTIQLNKTNVLILHVVPYKNSTSKLNKKEKYLEENKVTISESETGTYFDLVLNNYYQVYYEFIIIGNDAIYYRKKLLKKFTKYFTNIRRKYYNSSSLYSTISIEQNRVVELGSTSLSTHDIKHFIYPDMKTEIGRIETFIKNYDILNKFNAVTKYSILLYGEPGTGKSTFAKYIAVKFGMSIFDLRFNIDDENPLFSGYENSPRNNKFNPSRSVILIDELDLFVQNNYLDDTNSRNEINNKRVQFIIKFLDGLSGGNIVVATTNNIDIIDKRLLRPGRFDIIKELKPIHKSEIDMYLESYKSEVSVDTVKQKILNEHESECITAAELSNYILVEKLDEIGLSEIYKRNEDKNNG